ncbi:MULTISPECIES: YdeI/OmpD-associated family protein [Flavobacteriaceae]|uniref:YdeI/OmpD-associated family protein n=1 Tax=Flavobacteriaceae TaxID=49546 RepID=UPI0014922542|nr:MULTISPECIES: YdeI/OmpD-associated family protein [Allomuricauda]MDC6367414.1 YdeI/OmpD-associated family protein [Muricauda sp. AC10]
MEKTAKLEAYYQKEHPFKDGIALLRSLALKTESKEDYKWNFPVYTVDNKNVFGICRFKNHFGLWFFNGVFLKDPKKVLQNAQEGKTKGMRHWKFYSIEEIEVNDVLDYIHESIQNQKEGKEIKIKKDTNTETPQLLQDQLVQNESLKSAFESFSPYKQKEFSKYIASAKQEQTKIKRLAKIIPMIKKGIGLNDAYR